MTPNIPDDCCVRGCADKIAEFNSELRTDDARMSTRVTKMEIIKKITISGSRILADFAFAFFRTLGRSGACDWTRERLRQRLKVLLQCR
jgi:hypothetical protein